MSLVKPKVSSLVRSQLPEFIREDYQTFLNFLEAYYEFVEQGEVDLKTLRDLDTTLESFVRYFKNELASNLPYSTVDTKFLLQHIKEQYNAKGSEASFKLLFRVLFNKEVTVEYPSKQILRASDGRWNQDVSIFAKILTGNPQDPVGKLIDVVTPTKIIRVLVDRRQDVEIEIDRAIRVSDDVYEFLIDRRFFGNVNVGDRLRYRDDDAGIYFTAEILSTTVDLQILQPGSGFKVGDIYNIRNFDGFGSIMKVSRVNSTGGIEQAQFIKYGIGYSTDFTTTVSATSGQDVSGTAGTIIQRVGNSLSISERLDGFAEVGTINTADYNIDPSGIHALDGAYAGIVLREFGISSVDSTVTDTDPAIIKVTLGSLAKYPGYYVTNDSFLNDAIFIQDSRYYQAYSYVIKIDEKLEAYKTAVKNLIHPAGMAIFGEYDIRNEFDISLELESLIKILAVVVNDEVVSANLKEILNVSKTIEDSTLNGVGVAEGQFVTMQEIGNASDLTRTVPFWTINKQVIETTLNFNGVAEGQSILMLDETGSLTTRTVPFYAFSKALNQTHVINDGITVDNETQLISDETGSLSTRTVPYLDVSKSLNATTLNFDNALDNNTATMTEVVLSYSGGTRDGISALNMTNKQLDSVHLLNDGTTIDNETQLISDETGSLTTRTVPYLVVSKPLNETTFNFDSVLDNNTTSITEDVIAYGYSSLTRTGISVLNMTNKQLDQSHFLNDGITVDTETQVISDSTALLGFSKSLNQTSLNFDTLLDDNTTTMTEDVISYGYSSLTRTGISVLNMTNKQLDSVHVLNDGTTVDNETQVISDTDAVNATDLNRTRPAFAVTTTLPTAYYILATTTFEGNNETVMQDSGGIIDFNPYGEAGFFLNDGGLYVGNEIAF